ncbi:MAG: thiol-disulfide oxidoreductase DCC family protein [Flavobacteriaceae bacterium]|nr:thiol-disulfide oxidoreductase DCC family protein [Flavobacteriaceae bacterium]
MIELDKKYKIVLFDGVCNLCNGAVIFMIKRDKKDLLRFAALQDPIGQELVAKYGIDTSKVDSIVLIENDKYYIKTTAALRISKILSGLYPLFSVFLILPAFTRDWTYEIVAKYRYKWFGKKDQCMIPTPELKAKFL